MTEEEFLYHQNSSIEEFGLFPNHWFHEVVGWQLKEINLNLDMSKIIQASNTNF